MGRFPCVAPGQAVALPAMLWGGAHPIPPLSSDSSLPSARPLALLAPPPPLSSFPSLLPSLPFLCLCLLLPRLHALPSSLSCSPLYPQPWCSNPPFLLMLFCCRVVASLSRLGRFAARRLGLRPRRPFNSPKTSSLPPSSPSSSTPLYLSQSLPRLPAPLASSCCLGVLRVAVLLYLCRPAGVRGWLHPASVCRSVFGGRTRGPANVRVGVHAVRVACGGSGRGRRPRSGSRAASAASGGCRGRSSAPSRVLPFPSLPSITAPPSSSSFDLLARAWCGPGGRPVVGCGVRLPSPLGRALPWGLGSFRWLRAAGG